MMKTCINLCLYIVNSQNKVVFMKSGNGNSLTKDNSRAVAIKTFQSGWELVMGYPTYTPPSWTIWVPIFVIVVAIFSSITVMITLVNKHEHEELLYRMMPRSIVNRLRNGEENILEKYDEATLCQLDIVSFTTISGQMSASEVMDMLKILYTEFDKIAAKHEVFNVEVSLRCCDEYLNFSIWITSVID